MGKAEASVENYLVEQVEASGGTIRKLQWIGRVGAPDRLVWWTFPNVAVVEAKSVSGRYEASQKREMARMSAAGWPVYTVWSKADVDKFLKLMLARECGVL